MTADPLLARLDGVRETGRGTWIARCPSHDDGTASLSIRELGDGRTLINDFGGCDPRDVLAAVGLDFDALYPPRAVDDHVRRDRHPFPPLDVLRALNDETQVAAIVCGRIAYGYAVDWPELDRLFTAVGRIAAAADLYRPHPAQGHRAVLSRTELDEACDA